MAERGWSSFVPAGGDLAVATDLYQLTMAAAYAESERERRGTFELSVRSLPAHRNFLVFAGLEPALAALSELRFDVAQLEYLRGLPAFAAVGDKFFDRLSELRFRGDVWAMDEGSVFFPGEPVLAVSGDLLEAQIVETLLLSIINFQTTIASKAARMRLVAGDGVQLAEFGTRRAHGPQAGMWAARAAYLAGFDATSNVLAGQRLGIAVVGTMAHSFVMASASERRAFEEFRRAFPDHSILLVDTYDTLRGVERALELGAPFAGVRLDSGDLLALSREARRRLDRAGAAEALIFASGDVDEWMLESLTREGAPIDAYGVGSKLATSADAPFTGGVYKLVEVVEDGVARPVFKDSTGKPSLPGRKQVARRSRDGVLVEDRLLLASGEVPAGSRALLRPVVRGGEIVASSGLEEARALCRAELASLPAALRGLETASEPYPVRIGEDVERLLADARRRAETDGSR